MIEERETVDTTAVVVAPRAERDNQWLRTRAMEMSLGRDYGQAKKRKTDEVIADAQKLYDWMMQR